MATRWTTPAPRSAGSAGRSTAAPRQAKDTVSRQNAAQRQATGAIPRQSAAQRQATGAIPRQGAAQRQATGTIPRQGAAQRQNTAARSGSGRRKLPPSVLFYKRMIAATLAFIILLLLFLTIFFAVRSAAARREIRSMGERLEQLELAELERQAQEEAERLKNALQPERVKPEGELSATEILANTHIISHALGATEGIEGLNCLEGFLEHYDAGVRVFEVDFRTTSDGYVVLRHDWGGGIQRNINTTAIPTREQFLNTPILGKYTPMSFEDLLRLLIKYPDVCVVTDTKFVEAEEVTRQFQAILHEARKLGLTYLFDRFFIQIYSMNHFLVVNSLHHFPHYIYTLYQDNFGENIDAFRDKVVFCEQNGIEGITMWDYLWDPDYASVAQWHNVKAYVHTVNDAARARQLLRSGVSAVYTDMLDPAEVEG